MRVVQHCGDVVPPRVEPVTQLCASHSRADAVPRSHTNRTLQGLALQTPLLLRGGVRDTRVALAPVRLLRLVKDAAEDVACPTKGLVHAHPSEAMSAPTG